MNVSPLSPAGLCAQQIASFLPCKVRCSWWTSSTECYATTPDDVTRIFNIAVDHFHIRTRPENDPIQSKFTVIAIKGGKVVLKADCMPHEFPRMTIQDLGGCASGNVSGSSTSTSSSEEEGRRSNSSPYEADAMRFYQLNEPHSANTEASRRSPIDLQDHNS